VGVNAATLVPRGGLAPTYRRCVTLAYSIVEGTGAGRLVQRVVNVSA
jgi:hypothetical protein